MLTRRELLVTATSALTVGALGGVAFAEPDEALVARAREEGSVTWYTGIVVNQLVRPVVAGFKQRYGIDVRFTSVTEAETVLRMRSEANAGQNLADLFDSSGAVFPPLLASGLVGQFQPSNAASFSPDMKDKDGYYTAIYSIYLTTGYNTDLISEDEAPKNYEDLLDPRWQGKMAWADTPALSGPAGFIANVLDVMGDEKGMDYLKRLSRQKIVNVAGNQRVVLDNVIAGQYPIGLMIYNHQTYISRAKGAPVKAARTEPFVGHLGAIFLAKNAPRPNAARLFIEYLCSQEGQRLVRDAGYPPADPRIPSKEPGTSPVTAGFKYRMMTPADAGEPLAKWVAIYDELFKA